jgi:gas vesicle protein
MDRTINFIAGFMMGGLVAGGITLLVAPRSGRQTQAEIRHRIDLILEEGKRAAAERRAEMEAQFAEARRMPREY